MLHVDTNRHKGGVFHLLEYHMRDTYTVEEAARKLGIGRNSCYAAARAGQIPTIKIGKRLLVPRADLDKLLGLGRDTGSAPTDDGRG